MKCVGLLWSLLIAAVLIVAGCGDDDGESADTTTSDTGPLHVVVDDAIGVTGTATCEFSDLGTDPEGGSGGLLVVCELDLSDPRVTGTETTDRYRYLIPDPTDTSAADVWVAEARLSNDEGAWRGVAQAADDSTPCGETRYVGEGAYDGLEFHYYFCHVDLDEPVHVRGWIQSTT